MSPIAAVFFTPEDDFVKRARADHWFHAAPGSLVQTPDGNFWTIVYNNLDGYGVVEGDRPELVGADDEKLPPHTHLLREPHHVHKLPCIGELVRIIRRVMLDGSVRQNMSVDQARKERPPACTDCGGLTWVLVDGDERACPGCQPKMAEEERRERIAAGGQFGMGA